MLFLWLLPLLAYTSSTAYDVPVRVSQYAHNWYVVATANSFLCKNPQKVVIRDTPITIWKDNTNHYAAISDICPHRGASLSKGRIDKNLNCVVCPYHTFKFNPTGRMVQTPGSETVRNNDQYSLKTDVPYYEVKETNGWIYLRNTPKYEILPYETTNTMWVEPEAQYTNHRYVTLQQTFEADARTVTENSLDILHISEVHRFGNRNRPLPTSEKIDEYMAGEESIPRRIFGETTLTVENEYILPHYTVARVKFGHFVNTIVTSALPIGDQKTKLFVKAYRDNWVFGNNALDIPFDLITKRLMKKTLNEDKTVIDSVYFDHREGNFITKYDELTKLYREGNFITKYDELTKLYREGNFITKYDELTKLYREDYNNYVEHPRYS
jgi:nitrite reductase/ring-hydroxylating ferredoxin subunit/regulator of replication initiation timing